MTAVINRRHFVRAATAGAIVSVGIQERLTAQQSKPKVHYATGSNVPVTSTSREATNAALWALAEGGNAADAYMTAAITQTVSEPGLTSIGGAFGMQFF